MTKTSTEAAPLRYKIKTMLAAMPEPDRLRIKKRVLKATGISDSTYSRYLNQRQDDTTDIPAGVLHAFAVNLSTDMEDLFNPES